MIAFLLAFLCLLYHSQDVFVLSQTTVISALLLLLLFWTTSATYENAIYRLAWDSLRTVFDVPFPRFSRIFGRGSGEPQDDTNVGESKA
jgi:hypothetical protein